MDTEVNLEEMDKFASVVHGFADKISSAAATVSSIDYNVNAFGLLGAALTSDARGAATRALTGLRSLAANVSTDATAVTDTALDIRNNERSQTDRFRSGDHG